MKIILAYSGGLDTSVLLSWIGETYGAEMIAFCANIGQEEELRGLEAKAKRTGASKVYIDDLREEFARDFIWPMIQAGAVYEGQYFLGTSIARPLIAKRMVEIAQREKAGAIAHGATGKGNDQVRFELTAAALAPDLRVIAPWRDERFRKEFPGRAEMIAYCESKKIPVQASAKKPFSMDRNLLHISYEAGILEDPWFDASDLKNRDYFNTLSVFPEDAPDKPEFVTLDFAGGNCVAVNGRELSPLGVMQALNKLGGKHGIGRVDMVENRYVGMKSRGRVRDARRGDPAFRAPPDGDADDGPGSHAPARLAHPALRGAGVLRLLVRAGAAGVAGAGDGEPAQRHRHGAGETLQRQHHGRGPQIPGQPLQPAYCHDGSRPDPGLQPGRRHRLHPPQRPAPESGGQGAGEEIIFKFTVCDLEQKREKAT